MEKGQKVLIKVAGNKTREAIIKNCKNSDDCILVKDILGNNLIVEIKDIIEEVQ